MKGVTGLVITAILVITTALSFVIIGLYTLFASESNWALFFSSFTALVTALFMGYLFYLDDKGLIDIPNHWFDTLGGSWPIVTPIISFSVYSLLR